MKEGLYHILKGKFLISEDAFKNWRFIIFLSLLAIVMIGSSHSADKKVHQIARYNNQIKELRSEFVDVRSQLMRTRMESKIIGMMREKGLKPSSNPPQKIQIKTKK
jgi:hypothetical protein